MKNINIQWWNETIESVPDFQLHQDIQHQIIHFWKKIENVLIVENCNVTIMWHWALLRKNGFNVDVAKTNDEAKNLLKQKKYDATLLDMELDHENTDELLVFLKDNNMLWLLWIIFSTSNKVEHQETHLELWAHHTFDKKQMWKSLINYNSKIILPIWKREKLKKIFKKLIKKIHNN